MTKICGKSLTSSISCEYIPKDRKSIGIPCSAPILFVQIINKTNKMKKHRSKKELKMRRLGDRISHLVEKRILEIGVYHLLIGDADDFEKGEIGNRLRGIIKSASI